VTNLISCNEHGESAQTFVCSHIIASLKDGQPRGFVYTTLDPNDEPNAYCSACEEMLNASGGEWTEELEKKAGVKLLCYECFLRAARLNGVLH